MRLKLSMLDAYVFKAKVMFLIQRYLRCQSIRGKKCKVNIGYVEPVFIAVFFQDNPPVSKCLGIFGLSTRTTEADLRDVFDRYPGFVGVKLICDYGTGTSRGFGFLSFESVDDARYVSSFVNKTQFANEKLEVIK